MRIRTLRDVSPAHRKPVQVWYAAGIVRLSDDAMGRTGLRFGPIPDDLAAAEGAYAEADGIPMVLIRHEGEPAAQYTLLFDAPLYAQQSGLNASHFLPDVLPTLHLSPDEVVWQNEGLAKLFPAHERS